MYQENISLDVLITVTWRSPTKWSGTMPWRYDVENRFPNAKVTFSNVKIGPHCSTFPGCESPPAPTTTTSTKPDTTTGNNSDCPGGSLDACISMCPDNPADIFQACVNQCMAECM